MNEWHAIFTYIVGINGITFVLMGLDKRKAIKHKYRISERTFWLLSVIGGATGSFIGMNVFRHKTKHRSFVIGMPFLLISHAVLLIYFFMS